MALTAADWYVVEFYGRVRGQFENIAPMGCKDKDAVWFEPRLEGYRAALEIYGYPRTDWEWLTDAAVHLHYCVHRMVRLSASTFRSTTLEAVSDG